MPSTGFWSAGFALTLTTLATQPVAAQEAVAPQEASAASAFDVPTISEDALGAIVGREDIRQHANSTQNAGVAQNSVGDNSRTGDAGITGNAFQNLSGLSIVNVNSGNNVAINAAMTVNIALTSQP